MKKSLLFISLLFILCISLGTISATDMDINDIDQDDSIVSTISVDERNTVNDDEGIGNLKEGKKTFKDLSDDINTSEDYLVLEDDYKFNEDIDSDFIKGIKIDKSITIDGQGHTIDGSDLSAIFYADKTIVLKNIYFINSYNDVSGSAIYICGNNSIIDNCTFIDCYNDDSGGSIYLSNVTNAIVSRCSFINSYAYVGGSIYGDFLVNCSVSDCTFIQSQGYTGAAIYLHSSSNSNVSGCIFINSSGILGAAIYEDQVVNCSVNGCSFLGSLGIYGGCIEYDNCVNTSLSSCNFNNCNATYGGAIYGYFNTNVSVSYCTFNNCNANIGGAIYWMSNGTVSNCNFGNSFARDNGNAIYIDNRGSLSIINSNCSSIDDKAPICNDGTILSDVVITTLNGTNKIVKLGDNIVLTAKITASGMGVSGGTLILTVNNTTKYASSDVGGIYSTQYTVDFCGTKPVNANYLNSTGNQNVNAYNIISNIYTKFINPTKGTVYNGKYYSVRLVDNSSNALASKKVSIKIAGKTYNVTTDKNGLAKVKLALNSKYLNKSLIVSYKFSGDNDFKASSGSSNIKVIKTSTKIVNATKLVVKNHKNIYVKLTTKSGKVLANKVITMKSSISGKTYKIKTNSKGIANTDLWVKIKPLGKYYKYTLNYAGNKYYNSCTKTFKIKIVK